EGRARRSISPPAPTAKRTAYSAPSSPTDLKNQASPLRRSTFSAADIGAPPNHKVGRVPAPELERRALDALRVPGPDRAPSEIDCPNHPDTGTHDVACKSQQLRRLASDRSERDLRREHQELKEGRQHECR